MLEKSAIGGGGPRPKVASSNSQLLTKQEILQARYRSRLGNRIALVEHSVLLAVYVTLGVWGLAITSTPENLMQNGEKVTWMIVGTAATTTALAVALAVFAIVFRHEPEIRARHYWFLAHLVAGIVCLTCVCV